MEYRLTIDKITPQTKEWISKVQVIEKPRPRKSKDGKIRFQIAVVQDENEEKVAAVLYGEDIEKYADKLIPFTTYLISSAKVRVPLPYGVPINRFEWVIDRFTVVEEVKNDNFQDPPLPPPTRLDIVPFTYLPDQQRNTEFDIIAVVVKCGSVKYAGANNNKCREIIVMDTRVRDNRRTLMRYSQQTDSSLVPAPEHENIVPIADIPSQSPIQVFEVEGKLSLPNDDQDFYELLCSHCGQQYRTHSPKIIHCASCKQCAMLTPRARFEVVMTDNSGSAVATLIGEFGQKFLDMTAAEICEIISVKKQALPLEDVRQRISHRLFRIQLRKTFSRTSNMRLFVVSYFIKEDLFQLPAAVASEEIGESSNTELDNVAIGKELNKELESGESSHSNMEEVTPREELKNELTTEGSSSTKRQQTELERAPKKK